eukprot:snap_masked-scaffold_5-processed-gene-11.0-mRNA-1 protein AED:1.00 eAED:1.00 QI:0/-1/0/0/-1/1/1/0/471
MNPEKEYNLELIKENDVKQYKQMCRGFQNLLKLHLPDELLILMDALQMKTHLDTFRPTKGELRNLFHKELLVKADPIQKNIQVEVRGVIVRNYYNLFETLLNFVWDGLIIEYLQSCGKQLRKVKNDLRGSVLNLWTEGTVTLYQSMKTKLRKGHNPSFIGNSAWTRTGKTIHKSDEELEVKINKFLKGIFDCEEKLKVTEKRLRINPDHERVLDFLQIVHSKGESDLKLRNLLLIKVERHLLLTEALKTKLREKTKENADFEKVLESVINLENSRKLFGNGLMTTLAKLAARIRYQVELNSKIHHMNLKLMEELENRERENQDLRTTFKAIESKNKALVLKNEALVLELEGQKKENFTILEEKNMLELVAEENIKQLAASRVKEGLFFDNLLQNFILKAIQESRVTSKKSKKLAPTKKKKKGKKTANGMKSTLKIERKNTKMNSRQTTRKETRSQNIKKKNPIRKTKNKRK